MKRGPRARGPTPPTPQRVKEMEKALWRLARELEGRKYILLLYLFRLIFKSKGDSSWIMEELERLEGELELKGLGKELQLTKALVVLRTEEELIADCIVEGIEEVYFEKGGAGSGVRV